MGSEGVGWQEQNSLPLFDLTRENQLGEIFQVFLWLLFYKGKEKKRMLFHGGFQNLVRCSFRKCLIFGNYFQTFRVIMSLIQKS